MQGEAPPRVMPGPCAKPKCSPAAVGPSGCTLEPSKHPGHTSPRPNTLGTWHHVPSACKGPRGRGSPASGCAWGRSQGIEYLPSTQHTRRAEASLSVCSRGRAGTTPAQTDGHAAGEQENQAATPRTPMSARGGGLQSISWPAEPSRSENRPWHHRLPKDRSWTTRHIPAPKVRRVAGLGRGQRGGGTTHICDAFRGHPASGQPGHSPASSQPAPEGGAWPYRQAKIPHRPRPSRSPPPCSH